MPGAPFTVADTLELASVASTGQDEGGRGFQLVNEIAQRWGFLREPAGTCVWFEIGW